MIEDNKLSAKGFIIWGACAFFFLYEFFLRTVMGTFQHLITQDLKLSNFDFSLISTTVFLSVYGVMQIPVGIVVDNIGLKKSLIIGAFICAASSFGFAHSYSYPMAIFCRFLMGIGASFGFICLLISVYDWMPHRNSAFFIGLSQFIGTLGPMMSAGPLNELLNHSDIGWRHTFDILGIIGLFLIIIIFFFVENKQQRAGRYVILRKPEKVITSVKRVFYRVQPWYIAFFSMGVYLSLEYLSENEGRSLLILKGFDLSFASYMITLSWLGYAIGCPLVGLLSDFLQRRKIVAIISATLSVISTITILFFNDKLLIMAAFALLGLSASGQSVGFATIVEHFKHKFRAVALALNNTIIMIFSSIIAPSIGFFLDYSANEMQVRLSDYYWGFSVLISISVISFILAIFFIKETYCKSKVDFTYLNTNK